MFLFVSAWVYFLFWSSKWSSWTFSCATQWSNVQARFSPLYSQIRSRNKCSSDLLEDDHRDNCWHPPLGDRSTHPGLDISSPSNGRSHKEIPLLTASIHIRFQKDEKTILWSHSLYSLSQPRNGLSIPPLKTAQDWSPNYHDGQGANCLSSSYEIRKENTNYVILFWIKVVF